MLMKEKQDSLHSSKSGGGDLFFPDLKSPVSLGRCNYQTFEFNDLKNEKKLTKKKYFDHF